MLRSLPQLRLESCTKLPLITFAAATMSTLSGMNGAHNGTSTGLSIHDIPKSHVFTSKLPGTSLASSTAFWDGLRGSSWINANSPLLLQPIAGSPHRNPPPTPRAPLSVPARSRKRSLPTSRPLHPPRRPSSSACPLSPSAHSVFPRPSPKTRSFSGSPRARQPVSKTSTTRGRNVTAAGSLDSGLASLVTGAQSHYSKPRTRRQMRDTKSS